MDLRGNTLALVVVGVMVLGGGGRGRSDFLVVVAEADALAGIMSSVGSGGRVRHGEGYAKAKMVKRKDVRRRKARGRSREEAKGFCRRMAGRHVIVRTRWAREAKGGSWAALEGNKRISGASERQGREARARAEGCRQNSALRSEWEERRR